MKKNVYMYVYILFTDRNFICMITKYRKTQIWLLMLAKRGEVEIRGRQSIQRYSQLK